MEAGAPTPSLTRYIIDYARLQISSEKKKSQRRRDKGRETERESGAKKDAERGEISEGRLSSLCRGRR